MCSHHTEEGKSLGILEVRGEHPPIPMDLKYLNLIFRIEIAIYGYPLCSSPCIMWTHFRALGEKRYGTPMILALPSKEWKLKKSFRKMQAAWCSPTSKASLEQYHLQHLNRQLPRVLHSMLHQLVQSPFSCFIDRSPGCRRWFSQSAARHVCWPVPGQWSRSVDVSSASGYPRYSRYFSNSAPGFVAQGPRPCLFESHCSLHSQRSSDHKHMEPRYGSNTRHPRPFITLENG